MKMITTQEAAQQFEDFAQRAHNGEKAVLAVSPSGVVQLAADGERWNEVFGKQQPRSAVRIRPDLVKLDLATHSFVGPCDSTANE